MSDEKPNVLDSEIIPAAAGQPNELEVDQAEHHLEDVVDDRLDDPNMDHKFVDDAERALRIGDVKQEVTLAHTLEEDSPYVEVRAAVSNIDDPDMPVNTFRAWFLGLIAVIVPPGLNQLLYLRFPSATISGYVIIIMVYPMGKFLAWALPRRSFKTPWGPFSLNPGPFNVKEHSLISIMSLMSYQSAYAAGIPAVQQFTYKDTFGFGYGLLLVLSTQLLGLSFATAMRRFLVYPAQMIYPINLPKTTVLNALHGVHTAGEDSGKGRSRFKVFWILFGVLFFYQFFPGYIFIMLSIGNWFCLIAPDNVPLNQVLGTQSGLGLLPFTFDWQVIAYVQDPLASPWWAEANMIGGFFLFYAIIVPIMYYSNTFNQKYLPMFDSGSFDRFGSAYNTTKVVDMLDGGGLRFNPDKYNNYSQVYLPTALTMGYILSFAATTGVLTHVALFHGKSIWRQFRTPIGHDSDVHTRLMMKYKETPHWVYGALFLVSFFMGIGALYGWHSGTPWWCFIVAILLGAVFLLPIGIVMAVSNQEVGLNMVSELIIGYMVPHHPYAMMIFKTTMYMICYQGLQFISDQKLAHYMKVPPRSVFAAQVLATAVGGIVQIAVQTWAFSNIDDICQKDQPEKFNCANYRVFGTASIIWGLIGPKQLFSAGRPFNSLLYGFLIGAIAPIPVWLLAKKFPRSLWPLINLPVIFTATGNIPPATGIMYTSVALIGFIFNFYIKRYHTAWWSKYNYLISAALNAGSAIATVFIFFTLQYPNGPNVDFQESGWWGNLAYRTPPITNPRHTGRHRMPASPARRCRSGSNLRSHVPWEASDIRPVMKRVIKASTHAADRSAFSLTS